MSYVYLRSNSMKVDMRSHHLAITTSNGTCAAALWQHGDCDLLIAVEARTNANALHQLLMHPQLPRDVQQVSYACLPQASTLIPQALMANVNAKAHLELVHGATATAAPKSLRMDDPAAFCLFQGDRSLEERLLRHWPSATSVPIQAQCIQSALSRRSETPLIFVHLWGERLDVAIVNSTGLLLSNNFEVRSAEDLLYFLLFTAEQTNLQQVEHRVSYAGPSLTPQHIELLGRYCQMVGPTISEQEIEVKHPWKWVSLLERSLCVS